MSCASGGIAAQYSALAQKAAEQQTSVVKAKT